MEEYLKRRINNINGLFFRGKDDIPLSHRYAYNRGYNDGIRNGMLMAYENALDRLSENIEPKN